MRISQMYFFTRVYCSKQCNTYVKKCIILIVINNNSSSSSIV